MTRQYALHRGRDWITAPEDTDPMGVFTAGLGVGDAAKAWCTDSLDVALERQMVLRYALGLNTEVRILSDDCSM